MLAACQAVSVATQTNLSDVKQSRNSIYGILAEDKFSSFSVALSLLRNDGPCVAQFADSWFVY